MRDKHWSAKYIRSHQNGEAKLSEPELVFGVFLVSVFQPGGVRGITLPDPGLEVPGLARGTRLWFSMAPGLPRPATSQEFSNNSLALISKQLALPHFHVDGFVPQNKQVDLRTIIPPD